jgi:hypothetical protein
MTWCHVLTAEGFSSGVGKTTSRVAQLSPQNTFAVSVRRRWTTSPSGCSECPGQSQACGGEICFLGGVITTIVPTVTGPMADYELMQDGWRQLRGLWRSTLTGSANWASSRSTVPGETAWNAGPHHGSCARSLMDRPVRGPYRGQMMVKPIVRVSCCEERPIATPWLLATRGSSAVMPGSTHSEEWPAGPPPGTRQPVDVRWALTKLMPGV